MVCLGRAVAEVCSEGWATAGHADLWRVHIAELKRVHVAAYVLLRVWKKLYNDFI
jgi:hypothetical protein